MRNCPPRSWMPETRLLRGRAPILMTALILCAGAQAVAASDPPPLRPNSLVRVHLKEPAVGCVSQPNLIKGRLLDITATDLSLETHAGKPPTVLSLDNVARLDLNTRQGRRGRGALIGAGAGATVGLVWGLAHEKSDDPNTLEFDEPGETIFASFSLAAMGALVGALVAPDAKWQSIPPDQIRLGRSPTLPGETRLAVTLRF